MKRTAMLEKTLESPLDCNKIKPVDPKGTQSWVFIGRIDAEGETPVLWPLDAKNWLIRKDPDAGKGWRQEEKGMTEDELVGWHLRLDGHEFEQVPGFGDGQGSLERCSPWGCKEWETTEWLNWTKQFCLHLGCSIALGQLQVFFFYYSILFQSWDKIFIRVFSFLGKFYC